MSENPTDQSQMGRKVISSHIAVISYLTIILSFGQQSVKRRTVLFKVNLHDPTVGLP